MKKYIFSLLLILTLLSADEGLINSSGDKAVANGNKVTVEVSNLGSFSSPGNRVTDFVWNGLGYAYEFGMFVGAEVPVPEGSHPDAKFIDGEWRAHIISDGLKSSGEISGDLTMRWGWQPIVESSISGLEYLDKASQFLASSNDRDYNGDGKPDSWPASWDNVWPGKWREGEILGDQEIIYGMDDRDNLEFEYYPFPEDSSRKGLGIEVETRVVQYASSLYEDVLFAVYEISNVSEKDLNKVLIGFWGDPHIGGPDDWRDDWAEYDKSTGLAMAWDEDGFSLNDANITPGYFGLSFMQTPGNASDGIDNDGDGLIDESQTNGIDDDADWNSNLDDLGGDGLPGTGDAGEGDGIPSLGEPNFELLDVDEVDMIGTTSFAQPGFSGLSISDDEKMWTEYLIPNNYDTTESAGDYIFLPASGYFNLPARSTIHVGVSFILGEDREDLILNHRYAQKLYNSRLGGLTSNVSSVLTTVDSGTVFESEIPLTWETENLPDDTEIQFLAKTTNDIWYSIGRDTSNTGSIILDVSTLESSAFYTMQNIAISSSAFGKKNSPLFTIDNSGEENIAPEIVPTLQDGTTISGDFLLTWLAADVDGDMFDIQISVNSDLANETFNASGNTFILPTQNFPNNYYTISFKISDHSDERMETRKVFIKNDNVSLDSTLINHISGAATGSVFASVLDESELTGHIYKIILNDQNPKEIKYSVIDSTNGDTLVSGNDIEILPSYGFLFDGISLSFKNDDFAINENKTGWKEGSQSDVQVSVLREYNYPEVQVDYDILFFDHIVDTGILGNTVPFEIWNTTQNQKSKFVVTDVNSNGTWDLGETVLILENGETPNHINWQIIFTDDSTGIAPQSGDIFQLITTKSFSNSDVYILNTTTLGLKKDQGKIAKGFELFQNYPNPFNGKTTISFQLKKTDRVKLEIFNILGQRVFSKELGKFNPGKHLFVWDATNNQNQVLSSGVYLYRIKTGKRFSKVNKLVLMK
ncbi:MAG: T9SS C-terminal target domain-containing protein [Calditrichaeota bacterium]|nr:MAG: T9SS C-terminal target domain-containing protein [Calditrichota bacterium]MBL1205667.1 T9SS C-terminal target domain-containing protein [Calditrichota bacterium]NOG45495.1 T9SS type A sorting domain-containing protein [Calditrichota bacterium]